MTFHGNDEFVQLFLFDTQQAGAMTESLPAAVVDRAIVEVADLGGIQNLFSVTLEDVYRKRLELIAAGDGARVLKRTRNALGELESMLVERELELHRVDASLNDAQSDLRAAHLEMESLEQESILREQLNTIRAKIQAGEKAVRKSTAELYRAYLEPSNLPLSFWSYVRDFFERLDGLRIPEVIAKEVVEKILAENRCICGESVNEKRRVHLLEYQERMAGAHVVQEVFHIKDSVRDAECGATDVAELVSRLKQEKQALDQHRNHYRRLQDRLDDGVQDQIAALRSTIADLDRQVLRDEARVRAYTATDSAEIANNPAWTGKAYNQNGELSMNAGSYSSCRNLQTLRRAIEQLKRKEAAEAGVARLRRVHEVVGGALRCAFEMTMKQLKSALRDEANVHLERLQTTGMRIRSFETGIVLEDRQGVRQRGANTGGELSAQYSFLMALRRLGDISVPLVIDNPTKGLDGAATSAFQEHLPEMFEQCLMFIYPLERAGLGRLVARADHLATFHREDEDESGRRPDGTSAKERVVVNEDASWFVAYDPPARAEG